MWHTYLGGTSSSLPKDLYFYKVAHFFYNKTPSIPARIVPIPQMGKQISTYQRSFVNKAQCVLSGYNHQIRSMLSRPLKIARKNEKIQVIHREQFQSYLDRIEQEKIEQEKIEQEKIEQEKSGAKCRSGKERC